MVIKGNIEIEFKRFKGKEIEKSSKTKKAVSHWLKKLTNHINNVLKKEKNLKFKLRCEVE